MEIISKMVSIGKVEGACKTQGRRSASPALNDNGPYSGAAGTPPRSDQKFFWPLTLKNRPPLSASNSKVSPFASAGTVRLRSFTSVPDTTE